MEGADQPLPDAVRWLLVGAAAAALVGLAALTLTLEVRRRSPDLYRAADAALIVCAVLALLVGLTGWGAKGTLLALAVLLLAPVVVSIGVWLKGNEPDTVL